MNLGTSRVMIKAAEAERKKKERRRLLKQEVNELKQSVQKENMERLQMSKKSQELRDRISRIEATSQELLKTEKDFATSRAVGKKRYMDRSKPIEGKGLLTFAYGPGDEQMHHLPPGRSSRRTNFTTNYNNEHQIGSGCEWVETNQRKEKVLKRMEENEEAERLRSITPGSALTTESQKERRRMYSSPLADLGYHGKPSIIFQDIDQMKGYSLRRCRYYTDFCGNRIMMDPCDWPTQAGFVLTGL